MKTFFDSGVIISLSKGTEAIENKALNIFNDTKREFLSSVFVKIEVLPKAIYFNNINEVDIYKTYFDSVSYFLDDFKNMANQAYEFASVYGLSGIDSLHIASAYILGADEFITTEKKTKPMYRVKELNILYLGDM